MRFVEATVLRRVQVTPHMVRVTIGGETLGGYEAEGKPDEYCKVLFPHPGEARPVMPVEVDGLSTTPEGQTASPMRNYTIRRFDQVGLEIDIDFVAHEGGVAATWALTAAEPGTSVALSPAFGNYDPPEGGTERLLVADMTGLPAVGRILEEAGADERFRVVGLVTDASEEQSWESAATVEVLWDHAPVDRHSARIGELVVEHVGGVGESAYVWVAGEAAGCRAARKHLRHVLKRPASAFYTLGYWQFRSEEWEQRYKAVAATVEAKLDEAEPLIETDIESYVDKVDEIFEEAGL